MSAPSNTNLHSKCKNVAGILCDITGVLCESGEGDGTPIYGSIQAIQRLKKSGVPLRFCTNETQRTRDGIAAKLNRLGFDVTPNEIFAPAPATARVLKERSLRPHLLVHPEVLPEFSELDQSSPNCVVLGDATHEFSFENLNTAFQTLLSLETPLLISMGLGRYYQEDGKLCLDVGAFTAALEYATDVKAEVVGKPAATFFLQAVKDMGISPDKALMVGDDIVSDVGGAQACGLVGIQVCTGKYRSSDEPHKSITPDSYVDNLAQFVDIFLESRL